MKRELQQREVVSMRHARSNGHPPRKIRYAVVGLGYFAQAAVLPAFAHARGNSSLEAIVSADPVKLKKIGDAYGLEHRVTYDQFDEFLARGHVDAVYLTVPNHLHRNFTIRAARHGVHVLCEKPMAVREEDALDMMERVERAGVQLMIAYRLHFDPANLAAIEVVTSGKIGDPRMMNSSLTMQVEEGNIRLDRHRGGGALLDIGLYCINAARYLFRDEPVEAFAFSVNNGERRFHGVAEGYGGVLRFPKERLATFTVSFGAADSSWYDVIGTTGDVCVDNAFDWAMETTVETTIEGRTRTRTFARRDQAAAELVYFSNCILTGEPPEPSGTEGLADLRVIRALRRSAQTGKAIPLAPFPRKERPTPKQRIRRPAGRTPGLVHADSPHPEE
jgi:predicted dehydrogenase